MAAFVYFVLLAGVMVFLAAVGRMNRHWERVLQDARGDFYEEWHRAA